MRIEIENIIHFYIGQEIILHESGFSEPKDERTFTLSAVEGNKFRVKETGLWYEMGKHYDKNQRDKLVLRPMSSITEHEKAALKGINSRIPITPETLVQRNANETLYLTERGFDVFDLIETGQAVVKETIGKRTAIDFKDHKLLITEQEGLSVYYLKKPDTLMDSIKYINTNGILAVTGDYSNWIFCREFHPTAEGYCSDGYWKEKMKISSCQEPAKYDSERTEQEIRELLADEDREWEDEDREYLEDLLTRVDDEIDYLYHAYRENPGNWDYENIPFVKSVDYHFLAVLDGFEEICRRMKNDTANKK